MYTAGSSYRSFENTCRVRICEVDGEVTDEHCKIVVIVITYLAREEILDIVQSFGS
jgi:hypothetical protein